MTCHRILTDKGIVNVDGFTIQCWAGAKPHWMVVHLAHDAPGQWTLTHERSGWRFARIDSAALAHEGYELATAAQKAFRKIINHYGVAHVQQVLDNAPAI